LDGKETSTWPIMTDAHHYLAIDLGAESGRLIVGSLADDHLVLTETHRFANRPVCLPDGLHWDVLRLWSEIKTGLCLSSGQFNQGLDGVGIDSWGVDFALLDRSGAMLSNPHHYRDERTNGMLEAAFQCMPPAQIFASTGIQFMQINTLYQLLSISLQGSPLLDMADRFVTIPDLFNYWLSGVITNEFTNATTTQCFDPRRRDWVFPVLNAMGIPARIFGPVADPGTLIGPLRPDLAHETGLDQARVILPACHDTGSAVAAIPARGRDFAWISSGTWSIIGVEASMPQVDEKALQYNFTNEGGVFGTWRLSKNVMGLWLVQECRRLWSRPGDELSYAELTRQADEAEPFLCVLDPDDEGFLHPADMPSRIQQYCVETGQTVPQTRGQIVRAALEGIALKYRFQLERLEELTRKHLSPIHIVGGGTRNRLLNQFTADATGRTVIAGPVEATAIGNLLVQAIGLGALGSLAEARQVVHASFTPQVYEPRRPSDWDAAWSRFQEVAK
jgi:rhamnulokinase